MSPIVIEESISLHEGRACLLAQHCEDSSLPLTAQQISRAEIISCLSGSLVVLRLLNIDHNKASVRCMPTVSKMAIFQNLNNKQ